MRLTLPASGAAGSTLGVSTTLVVRSDAPRVVLNPATSGLVVLRGGAVVASAAGQGVAVPLPLRAGATKPAQVVPEALPLVGCDGAPLPAGRYTVRAVVGYGGDPLDAGCRRWARQVPAGEPGRASHGDLRRPAHADTHPGSTVSRGGPARAAASALRLLMFSLSKVRVRCVSTVLSVT